MSDSFCHREATAWIECVAAVIGWAILTANLATAEVDRAPVDLALSRDNAWLVTANQILGLHDARPRLRWCPLGFNTPTLLGVFRKVQLLHDGRSTSLEALMTGPHAPERVAGEVLSPEAIQDLIEFLKTL